MYIVQQYVYSQIDGNIRDLLIITDQKKGILVLQADEDASNKGIFSTLPLLFFFVIR